MSVRLGRPARVAVAAVSIVLGAAACGSDEPGAERTDPVVDTSMPGDVTANSAATTVEPGPGLTEADVSELEQQLDEIDRVLADIETQLAQD